MRPDIPDYQPTDRPSAKKLNTMLAELRRLSRTSTVPPLESVWGAAGTSTRQSFGRIMWGQLLGHTTKIDSNGHSVFGYSWRQMRERARGDFEPEPNGFGGDFVKNTAYGINNENFQIVVGVNDIVQLFIGYRDPLHPEWLFDASGGSDWWYGSLDDRCERAYTWHEVSARSDNWPFPVWSECADAGIFTATPAGRSGAMNLFDINDGAHNCQGGVDPKIVRMWFGGLVPYAAILALASQGVSCLPSLPPIIGDEPAVFPFFLMDFNTVNECISEEEIFQP